MYTNLSSTTIPCGIIQFSWLPHSNLKSKVRQLVIPCETAKCKSLLYGCYRFSIRGEFEIS